MQAYKTYARIQATGELAIAHLPFAPGALVEVLVVAAAVEFAPVLAGRRLAFPADHEARTRTSVPNGGMRRAG